MTINAADIIEAGLDAWTRDMLAGRVVRTPSDVALAALMAGHDDVHLHRQPDGTVTVTPMRQRGDYGLGDGAYSSIPGGENRPETRIPLWVDSPEGGE